MTFRLSAGLVCLVLSAIVPSVQGSTEQWTAPTGEELSMTSQPGAPDASAVVLNREDITKNGERIYVRLKILKEDGRKYADVAIPYTGAAFAGVRDFAGRTIHSDGTVIQFSGKPHEVTVSKSKGFEIKATIFSMPDVQTGSIVEYRYNLNTVSVPRWDVQGELFTRHAHFFFEPAIPQFLALYSVLPTGIHVDVNKSRTSYELNISNVEPQLDEVQSPPQKPLAYHVNFFHLLAQSQDEYWKSDGKNWSTAVNQVTDPKELRDVVAGLLAGVDGENQKLQRIYDAVQRLENTDYTRAHSAKEDKSYHLKKAETLKDIWKRQRGDGGDLTLLFVAMARAAGLQAQAMLIVDRDTGIFIPEFCSLYQFDSLVAIVKVDGKEQFFDPGVKLNPYGQLAWPHSQTRGLRQMPDGSTAFADTPALSYKDNRAVRHAALHITEDGVAEGEASLTYTGQRALELRQAFMQSSDEVRKKDLEDRLRTLLPAGMEISLSDVANADHVDLPLVLNFHLKGKIATASSKNLLLPQSLFAVNDLQPFTAPERKSMIYFSFPYQFSDTVEVSFPSSMSLKSMPANDKRQVPGFALYATTNSADGNKLTLHRDLVVAAILQPVAKYQTLKEFFGSVRTHDDDQILMSRSPGHPAT